MHSVNIYPLTQVLKLEFSDFFSQQLAKIKLEEDGSYVQLNEVTTVLSLCNDQFCSRIHLLHKTLDLEKSTCETLILYFNFI